MVCTAIQFLFGNVVSDLINFFLPDLHHQFMVIRIITDITGDVLFFQTTYPVLEAAGQHVATEGSPVVSAASSAKPSIQ